MKPFLVTVALVLIAGCGPFGDSGEGAGKDACVTYQKAMREDSSAIADVTAMNDIKSHLSSLDDETRRAFAALISEANANPFLPGADPEAEDRAAAKVRATCLSEHSVEIPN